MAEQQLGSDYWQSRYDEQKTGWDRGEPSPALMQWLESKKLTPCRIMVPGCGRGHEVLELSRRGFEVTAIDFASSAIDHLRGELADHGLAADLFQADVLDFKCRPAVDAIYEQTCLCALPPAKWDAYQEQLYHWLVPGGRLFASFMQSPSHLNPPFHCDLDSMKRLFQKDHWNWPASMMQIHHPADMIELAGILTKKPEALQAV